jgi:hypothetical protein
MKIFPSLLFFLFCTSTIFAQIGRNSGLGGGNRNDGRPNQEEITDRDVILEVEKPPITDYKFISIEKDTTFLDTTLHIKKDYKFNYLRRDNFGLLPFPNVGQTYNSLTYDHSNVRLKPLFGARARHFNYMEIEDILYYHVPTPLTELYFRTAFEQGQQMDAFFTVNTSEQFNFSIAYKGVRSLGQYQNILTSTGNFRFTTNYFSKNKRYTLKTHVVFQDLLNNENGGIRNDMIAPFVNGDPDYNDRGRIEVNFQNADNILEGRRFFMQHDYALVNHRDSATYNILKVGQRTSYENKYYRFTQAAAFGGFGPSYGQTNLRDRIKLEDFYTQAFVDFENNLLGHFHFFAGYTQFNYGYNTILYLSQGTITNRLKGSVFETGASYQKKYRGFELFGKAALNVAGEFEGNYILGSASYRLNENNRAKAAVHINATAPNYNFLLYQSDYVNYNWQTNFRNVKTQHLQFELESDKLFNALVSYTGIDDYAYFARSEETETTRPYQYDGRVNYLKIQAQREITYRKFGLEATLLYQNALDGAEVYKVPEFLGRASLYFTDRLFKNAMVLQTGITASYFTEYHLNAYDPVLAEFYVQNETMLGGFPLIDLFVNAKISQTRIFFKLEHFNSLFSKTNNYFAAPNHPYRDFAIRFGLEWNFFM